MAEQHVRHDRLLAVERRKIPPDDGDADFIVAWIDRQRLRAFRPQFDAQIQRVEIDGDVELEARFGTEVPVLFVNERKAFKYRCTPGELRKRLLREVRG